MAVTKGHGPEAVVAALEAGLADIGENYAGELLAKAGDLPERLAGSVRWHYLGAIQRNKIGKLAPVVSCWQSVARSEEAAAIGRRSEGAEPEIFVEVDFSGLPGRGGCAPAAAGDVVDAARRAGCRVRGLMTVAPLVGDERVGGGAGGVSEGTPARRQREAAREVFQRCAALGAELGLLELSMGMTDDLEEAVACGSTMIRIGTALFGPRETRSPHGGLPSLQQ